MKSSTIRSASWDTPPENVPVRYPQQLQASSKIGTSLLSVAFGLLFLIFCFSLVLLPVCFSFMTTGNSLQTVLAREGISAKGVVPPLCVQVNLAATTYSLEVVTDTMTGAGLGPAAVTDQPKVLGHRVQTRYFEDLGGLAEALIILREKFPHARAMDRPEVAQWSAEVLCLGKLRSPISDGKRALTKAQAEEFVEEIRIHMEAANWSADITGESVFDWESQTRWDGQALRLCVAGSLLQILRLRSVYDHLTAELL